MKFPRHIALDLTHNDHATVYEKVEEWCASRQLTADDWVSEEQRFEGICNERTMGTPLVSRYASRILLSHGG